VLFEVCTVAPKVANHQIYQPEKIISCVAIGYLHQNLFFRNCVQKIEKISLVQIRLFYNDFFLKLIKFDDFFLIFLSGNKTLMGFPVLNSEESLFFDLLNTIIVVK